eukprot:Rmarinus@m.21662
MCHRKKRIVATAPKFWILGLRVNRESRRGIFMLLALNATLPDVVSISLVCPLLNTLCYFHPICLGLPICFEHAVYINLFCEKIMEIMMPIFGDMGQRISKLSNFFFKKNAST